MSPAVLTEFTSKNGSNLWVFAVASVDSTPHQELALGGVAGAPGGAAHPTDGKTPSQIPPPPVPLQPRQQGGLSCLCVSGAASHGASLLMSRPASQPALPLTHGQKNHHPWFWWVPYYSRMALQSDPKCCAGIGMDEVGTAKCTALLFIGTLFIVCLSHRDSRRITQCRAIQSIGQNVW